jgi:hypothetical protein
MSLVCPNVGNYLINTTWRLSDWAETGSFLLLFLGINALTTTMLPILSVLFYADLPAVI